MKIFFWAKCSVNYLNMSFWHFRPQHSIFILEVCILFGGSNRGASRKVPASAKFPKGHNSHIKSLDSTVLCASCVWEGFLLQWNWRSHGWVISPKAKGKFGSPGSDGKILPWAVVCRVLPMVREGMDTQGHPEDPPVLICVFSIPLWEIYDYSIYFPIARLSNAPESGNRQFIPFFYSFLYKSGIFPSPLMKIVYNTNIPRYPRVRSSCLCFRKQLYFIPSVLPGLWIEISGLGCMPCPTLELWQLHSIYITQQDLPGR